MKAISNRINWQPPDNWINVKCIDMHTGGEPLRIPIEGIPEILGNSVLEKRKFFKENYDHLRTGLMFEPRGHADMYGAIITEPSTDNAHFDVFFIHNEGYSTMCGHAIIALTKFAFETGLVARKFQDNLIINTPAGKIEVSALIENDVVTSSSFFNVPSYLYLSDQTIKVSGIGQIKYDIAYGGAYYAIVDSTDLNITIISDNYNQLIDYGKRIKYAVQDAVDIQHPLESDLGFLYGTIFTGPPQDSNNHSRNVCVFAEGEVDRSATGTGVSARAALHFAKGELKENQPITIESILGSTMSVEVVESLNFEGYDAVIPKVSGSAHFTGESTYYFDPEDLWKDGFIFR